MKKQVKYLLTAALSVMISLAVHSQSTCYIKYPRTNGGAPPRSPLKPRTDWCGPKVIQLNFHFIQKSNGSRNFQANSDGYNGIYTGYDYAHRLTESLNAELLRNEKMHIPPGNNTQVLDKNYKFIVRGVYFHANDTAWNDPASHVENLRNNTLSLNPMQQMDVFLSTHPQTLALPPSKPGTGGFASDVSSIPGNKYTVCNEYTNYEYYIHNNFFDQWRTPQSYRMTRKELFEYVTWGSGIFNHELGHLLRLDHTVMWGWGSPCPTVKDNGVGSVDPVCDDSCWDTPSAWYMRDTLNAPRHPANVNGNPNVEWKTWGSNNRMEYSGYNALTPHQLGRIHAALENGSQLRSYLLCERLKSDFNLCVINPNITLYTGKTIAINKNCGVPTLTVAPKRYVKVVYNDRNFTEVFGNLEVRDEGYFEILSSCVCE